MLPTRHQCGGSTGSHHTLGVALLLMQWVQEAQPATYFPPNADRSGINLCAAAAKRLAVKGTVLWIARGGLGGTRH